MRISSNATAVVCYNQSIELTCHANSINMVAYKWISTKLKQPKETATIIVIATDNPVEYICEIIANSGEKGSSNISISSNGEVISYIMLLISHSY